MYIGNQWELIGTTTIDLSDYALKSELPTKTSDLTNDSGFIKQFLVTVTSEDGITYSSNKTSSEIIAAKNAGYDVICYDEYEDKYLPLERIFGDASIFMKIEPALNNRGSYSQVITVNNSGVNVQLNKFVGSVSATSTLSTGTQIGSITIDGTTTTLYAPEDTKVKQNDITGSTTGMRPVLLSAQANHKGTIADESLKSDTLLFYKVLDSLIITRSSSDDFDGRFAVTDSAGRAQAEILSYKEGTTTQTGIGLISAGNNQPSGVAGNAKGALIIYGEGNWQNVVYALDNRTTDGNNHNYVNYLPMTDGVLAAGVTTGVGSSTVPVYMAAGGELLACTLPTPTTYTMSMTGPTINLLADGVAASTITLPIWDGTLD